MVHELTCVGGVFVHWMQIGWLRQIVMMHCRVHTANFRRKINIYFNHLIKRHIKVSSRVYTLRSSTHRCICGQHIWWTCFDSCTYRHGASGCSIVDPAVRIDPASHPPPLCEPPSPTLFSLPLTPSFLFPRHPLSSPDPQFAPAPALPLPQRRPCSAPAPAPPLLSRAYPRQSTIDSL